MSSYYDSHDSLDGLMSNMGSSAKHSSSYNSSKVRSKGFLERMNDDIDQKRQTQRARDYKKLYGQDSLAVKAASRTSRPTPKGFPVVAVHKQGKITEKRPYNWGPFGY